MNILDLSPNGKKKFAKWMGKRHPKLRISELVKNSKNERQLFKMCSWIDEYWASMEQPEATQDDSEALQEDQDEAPKAVTYEVPVKYTRLKQHNFSRHVSHRLNDFITNHKDVCITKMIEEAATEDDLMAAMDEIENREKVVDKEVKRWTCRRL